MATELAVVEATVASIAYRNPDNDWSVLRVVRKSPAKSDSGKAAGKDDTPTQFSVLGNTAAQVGQTITAHGTWKIGRTGAKEFQASQITAFLPATAAGMVSFLSSGVIRGVGATTAKRLVDAHGLGIVDILDKEPARLLDISGIGKAKAEKIIAGWKEHRNVSEIMLFLHSQSLTPALCRRIYKSFGNDSISVIKNDPYSLTQIRGIGFKIVDKIGKNLGIAANNPKRIAAGIEHALSDVISSGSSGEQQDRFADRCRSLLETDAASIQSGMERAQASTKDCTALLVKHDDVLYSSDLAHKEEAIAHTLRDLAFAPVQHDLDRIRRAVDAVIAKHGGTLTQEQINAVRLPLEHRVGVLTGGPGCGKTHSLKVALAAMAELGLSVALAAPTGKAAQRASEATGMRATTVHRLLGIKGDFVPNNKVLADVLVIDESSMIDIHLMHSICRAISPKTSLLLVGDIDQLPSVGPGAILGDVMRSKIVPTVRLTQIFRQAQGSLIITNAHAINGGKFPQSGGRDDDFFLVTGKNTKSISDAEAITDAAIRPGKVSESVAAEIVSLVSQRIPSKYLLHPIRDIQVLCPAKTGACGVHAMNDALQKALNPNPSDKIVRGGTRFGVADKVMQVRNNYDLGVFNGDVGMVTDIDHENECMTVDFTDRSVSIEFDDLDDLRLAYAMTIHKSQGSQSPAVVIPMVNQHWIMLQRNLLYTGVTRAKQLAVVVGQSRSISQAVRENPSSERTTRLAHLIEHGDNLLTPMDQLGMELA